jgi:hypothetical protein
VKNQEKPEGSNDISESLGLNHNRFAQTKWKRIISMALFHFGWLTFPASIQSFSKNLRRDKG